MPALQGKGNWKFQIERAREATTDKNDPKTSSFRRYREERANRQLAARGVETKCLRG